METKKAKFGVRKKLMVFILPLVAIAFIALIMIAYQSSKNSIQEKTVGLLEAEGKASANSILAWSNKNLATLDNAVETMLNMKLSDEGILQYEAFYLETYEDFPFGIYIGTEEGKILDASGWEPEGDLRETSWYQEGLGHTVFAFGEPYLDQLTNSYIVTASRQIEDLNGCTAVAAADIDLSILAEVVSSMEVVGDGNALIIDANSKMVLAAVDDSIVGVSVEDISDNFYRTAYERIAAGNLTTDYFDSLEGEYLASIQPIEGTSWYIITRGLSSNIYSDLTELGAVLGGVGIVVILAICVVLIVLIGRITKPIQKLTDTIVAVTDGNFTTEVEVTGNDEVTVMAGNMRNFMKVMRETIGTIMHISDKIDIQAKDSNQISGALYESAEGQAAAMQQMRENLEELVESIAVIAENATKLAVVVSDTDEAGKKALDNISVTMTEADGGRNSMQSVTVSMGEMKENMGALGESITNVGSAAVKIDEITATIRGIAEQTNLLALNASIEAARAGEAGKGFAVVATEIKNLAETSADAADEISELISSVTKQIKQTVEQSQQSMEQIKTSAEMVYQASDQFNNIYESIENTNTMVHEMIDKIHDANDVASNMAAITEEQSASAEEIEATAVSIQELANTVTTNSANVKEESKDLAVAADNLKDRISKFTI